MKVERWKGGGRERNCKGGTRETGREKEEKRERGSEGESRVSVNDHTTCRVTLTRKN